MRVTRSVDTLPKPGKSCRYCGHDGDLHRLVQGMRYCRECACDNTSPGTACDPIFNAEALTQRRPKKRSSLRRRRAHGEILPPMKPRRWAVFLSPNQ